ncbi:MAG TPA: dihydrofolate reductase [Clostridiales bacterium]|nr:dihydrofolate reductase [Clostridiales bacterium]
MYSILLTAWVPEEYLRPYRDTYHIVCPEPGRHISGQDLMDEIKNYHALFALGVQIDKEIIDKGERLKVIGNFGVGTDNIDVVYAKAKGISVVNTPSAVSDATAEHAIALMMSVMRGIVRFDGEIRQGVWFNEAFSDRNSGISGKTLGIIGMGRIGKLVCKKAQGLGMNCVYYNRSRLEGMEEMKYNTSYLELDELLKISDCITLHLPYSKESRHMAAEEFFSKMKREAYFINTSRGKVVDEAALVNALKQKEIKGAGLDVFEQEPNVSKELLEMVNVVLTPHVASNTLETRINMVNEALGGIIGVLEGRHVDNIV